MSKNGILISVAKDQEGKTPYIVTPVNRLPVVSAEYAYEVARGNVEGASALSIASHDGAIGTEIATIGTEGTNGIYQYSTAADIDSISSDNAADTHDITIIGLDINYNQVVQTATLNGQNRVALDTPLLRVNTTYNASSTTTQGIIYVYVNTAITAGVPDDLTQVRSSIQRIGGGAGPDYSNEISTSSVFTVPAGYTGYIIFGKTTVSDSKALELSFWGRPYGSVFKLGHHIDIRDNSYDYLFKLPFKANEKTDVEVRATVDVGTAEVSAVYDIILEDNSVINGG